MKLSELNAILEAFQVQLYPNLVFEKKYNLSATGLKDIKGINPGSKDLARMRDIVTKSEGDHNKMIKLVQNMAKSITKIDKAQRRAAAALEVLPVEVSVEAAGIFMAKF